MRDVAHEAVIGARQILDGVVGQLALGNRLTRDEALTRYVSEHRGKPQAMMAFAARYAPQGTHPAVAASAYEKAMEQKLGTKN